MISDEKNHAFYGRAADCVSRENRVIEWIEDNSNISLLAEGSSRNRDDVPLKNPRQFGSQTTLSTFHLTIGSQRG